MPFVSRLVDALNPNSHRFHRTRRTLQPATVCGIALAEPRQLLSTLLPSAPEPGTIEPQVLPPAPPDMLQPAETAEASEAAPFPLSQTFKLHSKAGASKRIFLDFNGHTTFDYYWNNGVSFDTPAYSIDGNSGLSTLERETIQKIWQRVAEDFLPFNVDVTTENPGVNALRRAGGGDNQWGIRVVIGGDGGWFGSAGGVAYLNSFTWSSDTPAFVFSENLSNSEKNVAEAASHEAGHALGLGHDGTSTASYYSGHGSGATSWAPIMGVGYYRQVTQWSLGQYDDADNHENDLRVITTYNGFGYRPDDHGNSRAKATLLKHPNQSFSDDGIIARRADVDYFKIWAPKGVLSIDVQPAERGGNLDAKITLFDSKGKKLAARNPQNSLGAHLERNVPKGVYYIAIDGVGTGNAKTGYNDYASLGYFSITGTVGGSLNAPGEVDGIAAVLAKSAAPPAATTAPPATWADWLRERFA